MIMVFKNRAQAKKETGLSYLGTTEISTKLIKNRKVNNVMTYCIYLAPANSSGYEVCKFRTNECTMGCLATSGRVKMETADNHTITSARVKKSRLFVEQPEFFFRWVIAEITAYKFKAERLGYGFAIRINGTSDIDLRNFNIDGKNLFEHFSTIQFYDYTKDVNRFNKMSENYHLTFSYTGKNWSNCLTVLENGHNIAVIFDTKKGHDLPATFNGYPVIDGDLTDYRPSDPKGVIVGLRWKSIKDKTANDLILNSQFVVKA